MFRKILCPTDFSPGADHALRVAVRLAADADAEIVLAHAWYIPPLALSGEIPYSPAVIDDVIADDEKGLVAAVRRATDLGAKRVSATFLTGLPWEQLCGIAKDDDAIDLIVMGTHGRTGFRRILLGSVAEKVIRHSPCSVLAVRGGRDGTQIFQHILVPVDFSESSRYAAELAGHLASPGGQGIHLLHALDVPISYSGALAADMSEIDRRSEALLDEWAERLRATTKVPVAAHTRTGSPAAQALIALDSDITYDLAAVGSHGRTGLGRMLLGSVAEKIVRHAPCPVLVARRRAR